MLSRTAFCRANATLSVPPHLKRLTTAVSSKVDARQLFDGARYALLDCGGTIWEAEQPVPGINESLEYMRRDLGLQLRFITNNATAAREDMVANKFHRLGMTSVTKDEIFSSGYAAQVTLRRHGTGAKGDLFDRGNVLVLGNEGLHEELRDGLAPGFFTYGSELKQLHPEHTGTNCDGHPLLKQESPYDIRMLSRCWDEPILPPPAAWAGSTHRHRGVALRHLDIAAVVIGMDFKFTPTALALAAMALQQHRRGAQRALFVATNKDPQMPVPGGWLMPGCGCLVAALETAAGREADVVCGKPTTKMFRLFQDAEEIAGRGRVCPSQCVMFGDRLSTDIVFGNSVGCRTVHVATGCETLEDMPVEGLCGSMSESRRLRHAPTFAAHSIPEIIEHHCGMPVSKMASAGFGRRSAHVLSGGEPVVRSVLGDFRQEAAETRTAAVSASAAL